MVINVAEFILQLFIVHIYAFFFVNFRNIDRKDCFWKNIECLLGNICNCFELTM